MTTMPAPNDDLVRRLNAHAKALASDRDYRGDGTILLVSDAASALEAQAERISVLERALEPFAEAGKAMLLTGGRNPKISGPRLSEHFERARTTLTGAR